MENWKISEVAALLSMLAIITTLWWYIVTVTIQSRLDAFRKDFIREINGTYVRSETCTLHHQLYEEKIHNIELRVTSLEDKS